MVLKKIKWIFFILIGIIIAAMIVFIIFNNYFFIYTIKGKSMENALYNNDRILIKKLHGRFTLSRFDIIIFQNKDKISKLMIKRVIGLPGDNIEIKKDNIFINGKTLKQSFLKEINEREIVKDPKDLSLLRIPENFLYLLGDNRELSKDSRSFGLIEKSQIIGKVLFSYWPFKIVN